MTDWSETDLEQYLAEDPGGPVVMLNLLRFRPDGGQQKYLEYVQYMEVLREKYRSEVVYAGRGGAVLVADGGQTWDMVALVSYPDRQTFVDMVRDPVYVDGAHLRQQSLMTSVLQATFPLPAA